MKRNRVFLFFIFFMLRARDPFSFTLTITESSIIDNHQEIESIAESISSDWEVANQTTNSVFLKNSDGQIREITLK